MTEQLTGLTEGIRYLRLVSLVLLSVSPIFILQLLICC